MAKLTSASTPTPVASDTPRASRFGACHRTMLLVASMLVMSACGGESTPNTADAGGDGSTATDAGHDSGSNGGTDAGQDSGSNGGTDAGQDSGSNGGSDAGPTDAGFDAGMDACPPGTSTATAAQYCSVFCGTAVVTCNVALPDGGDCMTLCETVYGDPNYSAFQRGRMVDCLSTITTAADCSSAFACAGTAVNCP